MSIPQWIQVWLSIRKPVVVVNNRAINSAADILLCSLLFPIFCIHTTIIALFLFAKVLLKYDNYINMIYASIKNILYLSILIRFRACSTRR